MNADPQSERNRWHESLRDSAKYSEKNEKLVFVFAILGCFGLDRFYLGFPLMGICKLMTMGFAGIWWIADVWLLLAGKLKDSEGKIIRKPF